MKAQSNDKMSDKTGTKTGIGPVVSASHLASGAMPAMSEMEFALTVVNNAFSRWMVRCMTAVGYPGLTPVDVLILHSVNHREREKTLADICLVLNIEDTHVVTYAIKKLIGLELVAGGKRGKEKTVAITATGAAACTRYRDIREALLISSVTSMGLDEAEVSRVAGMLRAISGQYDQAARGAASL